MRRGAGRGVQRGFWRLIRAGLSVGEAAVAVGVSSSCGGGWFRDAGGVPPLSLVEPSLPSRFLTIMDREAIAVGIAQDKSIRQIGRDIGRAPSTVKREIGRNLRHQSYRSRAELAGSRRVGCTIAVGYSPHLAQARANLSSFLCKGRSLEVGVDSFGVDEGQLGEGLFPVGGDLSFDETSFGRAFGSASEAAFLRAVAGAFVLDVADRQP